MPLRHFWLVRWTKIIKTKQIHTEKCNQGAFSSTHKNIFRKWGPFSWMAVLPNPSSRVSYYFKALYVSPLFPVAKLWDSSIVRTEPFKTVGIFFGNWKLVYFLNKIGKHFHYNNSKLSISSSGICCRINFPSSTCENGPPDLWSRIHASCLLSWLQGVGKQRGLFRSTCPRPPGIVFGRKLFWTETVIFCQRIQLW